MKENYYYILTEQLRFIEQTPRNDNPYYQVGHPIPFISYDAAMSTAQAMDLQGFTILKAETVKQPTIKNQE